MNETKENTPAVFAESGSPESWAEALLRFAEHPALPVPVLRTPPLAASTALLHGSSPKAASAAPGPRLVVALAASEVSQVAPAIASAFDASLHLLGSWADVTTVLPGCDGPELHLAVLGLTSDFEESDLRGLQDAAWYSSDTTGAKPHLGFLIAPDIEALAWMVAKTLAWPWRRPAEEEVLNVFSASSSVKLRIDNVLLKQETTFDSVAPRLLEGRVGLLSLLSHGRDDVIHLHDTVICANTRGKVETPLADNLPTCAYTGRCFREEVEPDRMIPAERVRADVVFTNSCMGFRLKDAAFPEEYLLVHGFQRGSVLGYIGCSAVLSGMDKLNLLVIEALRAGVALGGVVSLLNDHLRYERSNIPAFVLMGAPWLTSAPGQEPGKPASRLGFLDAVEIGRDQAAGAARDVVIETAGRGGSAADAHFFASRRTRDAARAITGADTTPLSVGGAFDRAARRAGESIENLADLPLIGFRSSRQGNILVSLREQITNTAKTLAEALESAQPEQARKRLANLRRAVAKAEADLAASLHERGVSSWFEFEDLWSEVLLRHDGGLSDLDCANCGRRLRTVLAEHPLFPRVGRRALDCPKCTTVQDLDPRGDVQEITVATPPTWERGSILPVSVRIVPKPDLADRADVHVGIYARNGEKLGVSVDAPALYSLVPGETLEVELTAKMLPLDNHFHQDYLKAFAISKGTVAYASCPVWHRPQRADA